jgi:hypothetical protein
MCDSEHIATLFNLRAKVGQTRFMWSRVAAVIRVPFDVDWKLIEIVHRHQLRCRVGVSKSRCRRYRSFVVPFHLGQTGAAQHTVHSCRMHHLKLYACSERDFRVPTTYIPTDTGNCTLMLGFFSLLCSLQWVLQLFQIQDIARGSER